MPHMRLAEHTKLKQSMASGFDGLLAHVKATLLDYLQTSVAELSTYKEDLRMFWAKFDQCNATFKTVDAFNVGNEKSPDGGW